MEEDAEGDAILRRLHRVHQHYDQSPGGGNLRAVMAFQ